MTQKRFGKNIKTVLLFSANALLMVYCLLVAAVILYHHPVRLDLTADSMNTLSDDTLTALENLQGTVEVVMVYGDVDPRNVMATARVVRRSQDVLRQFSLKSDKVRIIDMVNIHQQGQSYLALKEKYNLTGVNRVTFLAGDRKQDVRFEEMADYVQGQGGRRHVGGFRVERAFAAAIRRLQGNPVTIYVMKNDGIQGMAGPNVNDVGPSGLSKLVNELHANNYVLKHLDILRTGKVPDDCDILMGVGLMGPLPQERPALEKYLLGGGRFFLALNPRYKPVGLAFLAQWGIHVHPAWCVMEEPYAGTKVQTRKAKVDQFNPKHPITAKFLNGVASCRFDSSRPLALVQEGLYARGEPLIWMAGKNVWGERYADPSDKPWRLDPNDFEPPLLSAVASEYENKTGPNARVVVVGTWSFLQNQELENFDHASLLHNALWWLHGQESSIGVRSSEDITRNVNFGADGKLRLIFTLVFLAIVPGSAVIVGMAAYFIRRK